MTFGVLKALRGWGGGSLIEDIVLWKNTFCFVSFPNIDDYDGEHQRDEVEEGDVGEEHCDVDGGVPVQFEITFRCLTNYWR